MKIDFLMIGGEKCASTYLHYNLMEHPDIYMPMDEITFFENPDYHNNGLKKLEKLLKDVEKNKIIGIKRPNYLTKPEVPLKLSRDLDNPKLIVILRNPIERFISVYHHNIDVGFVPLLPLNIGTKKILSNKMQKKYPRSKELLEFGFYYKYLNNYFKYFNKKNILILLFDDLKKDKKKILKQCYSFLNVDPDISQHSLNSTPQKVEYSFIRLILLNLKNKFVINYSPDKLRMYMKKKCEISKIDGKIIQMFNRIDKHLICPILKNTKNQYYPIISGKN